MSATAATASITPRIPDLARLPDDALLDRVQVAALTGFTPRTLRAWASKNRGPAVTRVEGVPRYRVGDYRKWIGAA